MSTLTTRSQIMLYKPNIIGYIRFACLILGSYIYTYSPKLFIFLYFLNFFGDFIDGIVARKFKECSGYGAILDCCIDSLGNVIISYFICHKINGFLSFIIFFLANIDVIQQWYQNLICYKRKIYWKDFNSNFFLVTWYYGNDKVLDIIYTFQHSFLMMSIWKIEFGLESFFANFFYFFLFLGFALNGLIRVLAVIDCCYKMAEADSQKAFS